MSMASTTKIMTALVAVESADISKIISVPKDAVGVEGSSIYLFEGERLTLEDLLYAMLLESANDAAAAIAIAVGGSIEEFAEMMNDKATSLGLGDTHFANPHGLDHEEHYTTARSLAIIAREALKNETLAKIFATKKKTIPQNNTEGGRLLINHNKLLSNYDGAIGVKTGFTKKSGRCLVSAAQRDGVRLICVTLSAPDDWRDHTTLLNYGFSNYSSHLLASENELRYTIPVIGGDKEYITVTNRDALRATLPNNTPNVKVTIELPRFVYAPVREGDEIGKAIFTSNGKAIAELPLLANFGAERIKPQRSFFDMFSSLFK
jgi:D-alanyl-D-alanine carboxypeptidase